MKQWILAGAACLGLAPAVLGGPIYTVDDSMAAAVGWCESMAGKLAELRPAAELRAARAAVCAYAAEAAPAATAAQARGLGLQMPARLDPAQPVVVLLHGLDMDPSALQQMAGYLRRSGRQVATFGYPADGPIAEDSALLGRELSALEAGHPDLRVNLIAYSLGSLVARDYVEGPAYGGHVDHLILLAPPNHGSGWAPFEPVLKAKHDFDQYRREAGWRPSWIVTEGLCEAAEDLLPHSSFLDELNARPRRAGVRYTIIDGDEHVLRRMTANALDETAEVVEEHVPARGATVSVEVALTSLAAEVRRPRDSGDGAVTLHSAALAGVSDVVTVHADHGTIFWPDALGNPPAAWPVIADRLSR